MQIEFKKHFVTDGKQRARVNYSFGTIYNDVAKGHAGGTRECVTLYAKDGASGVALSSMLDTYKNESDSMTDYFTNGRARIFPGDALYPAALARCVV